MSKLRVAHITWEFPSVTETFVVNEVEALTQNGCDVRLIAFQPSHTEEVESHELPVYYLNPRPRGAAWEALRALGALLLRPVTSPWLAFSCRRAGVSLTKLPSLLELRRHLEAQAHDLIHAQFGYVGYLCVPVLRWFESLPLVVSFRGQDASALPRKHPGLYTALFERGDLFLARSEAMRKDLEALGCPPQKIRVHHSGINLAHFPYKERHAAAGAEPVRILFVGRLVEKKGILEAIAAFAQARQRCPNIQLRIVGDGPLRERVAQTIIINDVMESVVMLGQRPHAEVVHEMSQAHLFILPCRTAADGDKEGIPNALMEAMASGLPVLSTHHAGIPECVEEGVSGFLASEGDVDELATGLIWLVQHPERWSDMGRAGRAKIEAEFNRDIQAQRLLALYEEIIKD